MKAIQKIKSNLLNTINVLRHGLFLSLYSYIKKASSKLPWRSRTSSPFTTHSLSTHIRNVRLMRISGVASSFLLGLLALAIIIPLYNVSGTEDTEAAVGTEVDSSISFTSTRNTASVAFNPTSTSGTFASSTAGTSDAAFSISTTNSQGYTLKLKSSNGTTLKTSTSAANTATLSTISTSGITSSSFTTNTWGYLPSYYNSTTNTTKYYPATTSDVTLRTTSSANSTAHSYTIGIGAKADLTREAGTYTLGGNSSAMILSYAVNPTTYEIVYRDNSGDSTVANMPTTTQSGSVSATSVALAPNKTPTRTGYSLTGWCLSTVGSSGTTCTGTTIATNGTLKLDRTTSNSATLFALWTPNKYTCTKQYRLKNADGTWGSYTTDTTEQVEYNSTCNYSKTITDYKGSETGSNGSAASTSATMNSTDGITLQVSLYRNTYVLTVDKDSTYISSVTGSGTYRWGEVVPITATVADNSEFTNWTESTTTGTFADASSASTTFTMGKSDTTIMANGKTSKIWFQNATSEDCGETMYDNRGNDTYKNIAYTTAKIGSLCWMTRNLDLPGGITLTSSDSNVSSDYTLPASSTSGFNDNFTAYVYNSSSTYNDTSCGNKNPCYSYYSFKAAAAGSNPSSGTVSTDICPYGWRLPTNSEMSGITSSASSFSPVYSGNYYNFTFSNGGSEGYWWSSTVNDDNYAYYLYYYSGSLNTNGGYKRSGFSIRCVAKPRYNVTIATTNNATGIVINGITYSNGDTVSLIVGDTYTISGTYASNSYGLGSWSVTSGGALAPTASDPTTLTVTGDVTLTLTGKAKLYLQDLTLANCPTAGGVYYDKRDEKSYTVKKINSYCWMTQNLAIGCNGSSVSSKSLTSADSNVSNAWSTPTALLSAASSSTNTADYTNPRMQCSSTAGAWYNYAAATAGTITGSSNSNDATKDICPAGWHLPTGPNTRSGSDINKLVGNTTSGWQAATTGLTAFGAVAGGYYWNGSLGVTEYGYWWSATAGGAPYCYNLVYNSSSGKFSGANYYDRYNGLFVRCVRTS